MKFSPTATLALVLAAGMAGGALAQGTTTAPTASNPAGTSQAQRNGDPQSPIGAPAGATAPAPMRQGSNAEPASSAMTPPTAQSVAGADPQVRQAQQQLRAAGLYNGPADGKMDPDTRMAIARFQEQHRLRRTEALDQGTLAQLMESQTAGSGSSAPAASTTTPKPGNQGDTPSNGAGGNTRSTLHE